MGIYKAPKEERFRGWAQLIRYADDFVAVFQYKNDAERFYSLLIDRFSRFGLRTAEEKTRILRFGRFAAADSEKEHRTDPTVRSKPETFDFLGFTFYCSTNKKGRFCCKVRSAGKRVKTKLKRISLWMKQNRSLKLKEFMEHIRRVLTGYFNYYCVTCNEHCTAAFRYQVCRLMFKWLNRRSQRKSFNWTEFMKMLEIFQIPKAYFRVDIYRYRDKWLTKEPCA